MKSIVFVTTKWDTVNLKEASKKERTIQDNLKPLGIQYIKWINNNEDDSVS